MPVVFVIAVLAVLVGVFFAATGRGGELAYEQTDHAPLDLGPVSAPDIALLRPPTALWGYNMQVTDEALDHIARAVRDRDITIAYLQEELGNREPRDLNAPFGTVPPTPPDAFYPLTNRDDSPRADADPYPPADPDASRQAGADGYALADPDASRQAGADGYALADPDPDPDPDPDVSWYPGAHALSDTGPGSTVPSDAGDADAGPAPVTPDAPPPRSLKPPGILVASPPREAPQPQEVPEAHEYTPSVEATQPYEAGEPHDVAEPHDATQPYDVAEPHEATQPYDVAEPHEVTRPSETLPGTDDTLGPQGPFDTHDWWGEQEEAAREDARRQAEAQHAGLTPSGGLHAPEPPADAPSGSAAEDNEPPDEAADQASAPSGPTGTVPNPVLSPPSETGTSPGGAGQPPTGPAKPLTPHDAGPSIAGERAW